MAKRNVDSLDYEPPLHKRVWFAIQRAHHRRQARRVNATCDACGYRGIRTRRGKWCPACYEDLNGELILDRRDQKETK